MALPLHPNGLARVSFGLALIRAPMLQGFLYSTMTPNPQKRWETGIYDSYPQPQLKQIVY